MTTGGTEAPVRSWPISSRPWLGANQTILDAGCGPGGNGAWLARHGEVAALDLAPEGLRFVRDRRPELNPVRGSVTALPFPDGRFDVVVAVTVVYSVPDDHLAVAELARVLRPGGALLLIEPAFRALRRAHDTTVRSVHRYRRAELAALAAAAGLTVRRATYAYSFLTPPAAALSVADRLRPRTVAPRAPTSNDAGSMASSSRWLDSSGADSATATCPSGRRRSSSRRARGQVRERSRRPRPNTTSRTQSPARSTSELRTCAGRKNCDWPCTRR